MAPRFPLRLVCLRAAIDACVVAVAEGAMFLETAQLFLNHVGHCALLLIVAATPGPGVSSKKVEISWMLAAHGKKNA